MKKQEEYFGIGSIRILKEIIAKDSSKKIFLVTGKKSFELSGAKKILAEILKENETVHFDSFGEIPKSEDIETGIDVFKKSGCEEIIAIGGGSVIDVAKLINILSFQNGISENYITGRAAISVKGKRLTVIPTTSGSGSEATHFAVVYKNNTKYSLAHEYILPDVVLIEPELTYSLSPLITATSGIDAFSQAIESHWCINSNEESKSYSSEAIKLISENIFSAVNSPSLENRINMSRAANLSGKAINITKTTAPHSISYSMTSYFGVPHGQAVSLTLGEFLLYNYEVNEKELNDKRGVNFVKNSIEEISNLLGCESVNEASEKIKTIMKSIGLKTKLSETGIKSDEDINLIADNVNTERLQNNPRALSKSNLKSILKNIS